MPSSSYPARSPRRGFRFRRARRWWITAAVLLVLGLISWAVLQYTGVLSGKGDPVTFGDDAAGSTRQAGAAPHRSDPVDEAPETRMPTGPAADLREESRLADGTVIAKTTLQGAKSGFTGKVWVWAPKQYKEPQYRKSGFPVLVALPGGPGASGNYWIGTNLKLQSSIAKWSQEGKAQPFIVVMPVLNPGTDKKEDYHDGSDIPGRPKMGTWLAEDVPDFVRANFRTLKSRDGWAFMGSSSGGFAGLKTVLQHPDRFKAVIASGPDIVPDSPHWKGHEAERQANNPQRLAQQLIDTKGPDVYLAFQYGTAEHPITINGVNGFIKTYGDKGPVHTHLTRIPGGLHNAETYVRGMGMGPMEWISQHLQGPTPRP
ncbi:alpha/beta hydrolase [Streptomyces triculaminicus]|uniref:alpha/beta hydrolase n=1 Tax=Streptomyces triculaminicus TaxID=2816232 RepID=UPI0037D7CE5C